VAVLDDYQRVALSLGGWGSLDDVEVVAFDEHFADEDALVAAVAGFEVVVAMRERTALPVSVIERLPRLRLIVTTGMRNVVIDVAAANRAGVVVMGTYGVITPTSELTWGLIFAVLRDIPAADASVRGGGWQLSLGTGLAGRTLGIVGLGNLGAMVAAVGLALKMRVVAWSQNLTPERAADVGVALATKEELFATADVVTIHLVLSDRTRGLVGEPELRSMKPTSVLINTSRGPIVDEAVLVRALAEGWIKGAGIDVYGTEPLPADHPLRRSPRCVLTPHIGYVTDDNYAVFFRHIVEDIAAFQRGEELRVVTPG